MSIPIQDGSSFASGGVGPTSPVIGEVNFGWISEAWRLFSAQIGPWIVATLLLGAPGFVLAIVFYAMMWSTMFPGGLPTVPLTPGANPAQFNAQMAGILPVEFGFIFVYAFWLAFMYGGMFRMAVRQVRGVPVELKDIFRGGPLFGRMLGAIFLLGLGGYGLEALCLAPMGLAAWLHGGPVTIGLCVAAGVIALLVLGLLAYSLLLPAFALIGDGVRVIDALKRSAVAMKPRMWAAAGLVFVFGVLLYASELLCGIGLLATIPMIFLVCALAYRDMIGMPDMAPLPGPSYAPSAAGVWPPAPGTWPPSPNAAPLQTPQQYPQFPPQSYPPPTPPQQYSPPPVQQYPSEPPTQYPPPEPRRPLSGDPLDGPEQTPPDGRE